MQSDNPKKKYTATVKKSVFETLNNKSQTDKIKYVPPSDEPSGKIGMGDLKQSEYENRDLGPLDVKRTSNDLKDLYQTPQDATKREPYSYKRLDDKPIIKKVYKDRTKDPTNREPLYPIPEAEETQSGSIVPQDINKQLNDQEQQLQGEYINKINSGDIKLPFYVKMLPQTQQLQWVGAAYNNNPVFSAIGELANPLIHLENVLRGGIDKVFGTNTGTLTPSNLTPEDADDELLNNGVSLSINLIPLAASIKGANLLLKGIKSPYLRHMLSSALGFTINSQPELLDNLSQGKITLKDYAIANAETFGTGLAFGLTPPGTKLRYEIPYQTVVPTMVPVITKLVQGQEIDDKQIINSMISNVVLSMVMGGKLPKTLKVEQFAKTVEKELSGYKPEQLTRDLVETKIAGLLEAAKNEGYQDIPFIDRETKTIENVRVPQGRDVIEVDEKGNAVYKPEKKVEPMISPIKLTEDQIQTLRNKGMTDAEIQEAQVKLFGKPQTIKSSEKEIQKRTVSTSEAKRIPEKKGNVPEDAAAKEEVEKVVNEIGEKVDPVGIAVKQYGWTTENTDKGIKVFNRNNKHVATVIQNGKNYKILHSNGEKLLSGNSDVSNAIKDVAEQFFYAKKLEGKEVPEQKKVQPISSPTPGEVKAGLKDKIITHGEQSFQKSQRKNIVDVPIDEINTDTKRFQNRDKEFSEESVQSIVDAVKSGDFDFNKFDEIRVWKDPKTNKYYVLAGHSRLEAFNRLKKEGVKGFETIPSSIMDVPESEAIKFAKEESNVLGTQESHTERAGLYHSKRKSGTPEKDIKKEVLKREKKNSSIVYALSFLNPKGKTISALKSLGSTNLENKSVIETVASYIGKARQELNGLTDKHENEMFDWLMKSDNMDKFKNKTEFVDRIEKVTNRLDFKPEQTLNLDNRIHRSSAEQIYDKRLAELKSELKDAKDKLDERRKYFTGKGITGDELTNKLKNYEDVIRLVQKDVNDFEKSRNDAIKNAESQEMMLLQKDNKKSSSAVSDEELLKANHNLKSEQADFKESEQYYTDFEQRTKLKKVNGKVKSIDDEPLDFWKNHGKDKNPIDNSVAKYTLIKAINNDSVAIDILDGVLSYEDFKKIEDLAPNTRLPKFYLEYERKLLALFEKQVINESNVNIDVSNREIKGRDVDVKIGDELIYDGESIKNSNGDTLWTDNPEYSHDLSKLKDLYKKIGDVKLTIRSRSGKGGTWYLQTEKGTGKFLKSERMRAIDNTISEVNEYLDNLTDTDIKEQQEAFKKLVKTRLSKYKSIYNNEQKRIESGISPEEQKAFERQKREEKAKKEANIEDKKLENYIIENNIPTTIKDFKNREDISTERDATKGDVILFSEAVFRGKFPNAKYDRDRNILGIIEKESYGDKRGQHSFKIRVLDSDDINISEGDRIIRKGRNVYGKDFQMIRLASEQELQDKHDRGQEAKEKKWKQWYFEATQQGMENKLERIPKQFLEKLERENPESQEIDMFGGGPSLQKGVEKDISSINNRLNELAKAKELVSKSFPESKIITVNDSDMGKLMKVFKKDVSDTPLAATYEGKVYINKDKANASTPFHEIAGHIFNRIIAQTHPELWEIGKKIALSSKEYSEKVRRDYPELAGDRFADEILSQAVGDSGERLVKSLIREGKKEEAARFKKWIARFWDAVKSIFKKEKGIESLTPQSTIREWADVIAKEISKGRKLETDSGPMQSRFQKAEGNMGDLTNKLKNLDERKEFVKKRIAELESGDKGEAIVFKEDESTQGGLFGDAPKQQGFGFETVKYENVERAKKFKDELKSINDQIAQVRDSMSQLRNVSQPQAEMMFQKDSGSYMNNVKRKVEDITDDLRKQGFKGEALRNRVSIETTKHLFNDDPTFKAFPPAQKRAVMKEMKRMFRDEYRKESHYTVDGFEYVEKGIRDKVWNRGLKQSLNVVKDMGDPGKEFANRMEQKADDERSLMGKAEGVIIDISSLSKHEYDNLTDRWEAKMNEQVPPEAISENVREIENKINQYFEDIAGMLKQRGFTTTNKKTGDIYSFTPKEDYRPRMLNTKVDKLGVVYNVRGEPVYNKEREKVLEYLIDTKQANDFAQASLLLDERLSKDRIFKAGNVEYSRLQDIRLPDEYYIRDPKESLIKYAKRVSKRIAFVDNWGMDGSIEKRLLDDMRKNHWNYKFAEELFRFENDQLTQSERDALKTVNSIKGLQALTKFTPFTTLRNSVQGFLGSTTRGNLLAGIKAIHGSLDPVMRRYARESGALADSIENYINESFGGESQSAIGKLTGKYLDWIQFTRTDRANRIMGAIGGLEFMKDMLKRVQKDSVLKKRAIREFEKMGLDINKVLDNGGFTEAQEKKIMRRFAYETQFGVRAKDLPLFWSSPYGKLATQWKPFGYKMTQLIRDSIIGELKQGNAFPLLTYMVAYGVTGEGINYVIDHIRHTLNFNPKGDDKRDPNEESLIGQAMKGNIGGFLKRYIEDLSGLGALSFMVDIGRSMGYDKSGAEKLLLGPALSEIAQSFGDVIGPGAMKVFGYNQDEDFKETMRKTLAGITKTAIRNLPGSGLLRTFGITKKVQDWLFPPKSKDEYEETLGGPEKDEYKKIKELEKERDAAKKDAMESRDEKDIQRYRELSKELDRMRNSKVWKQKNKFDNQKKKEEESVLHK